MLKACATCGVPQKRAAFENPNGQRAPSPSCETCRSAATEGRPWTTEEITVLRVAARGVLRLWSRYLDILTEDDRKRLRALIAALDRERRPPT